MLSEFQIQTYLFNENNDSLKHTKNRFFSCQPINGSAERRPILCEKVTNAHDNGRPRAHKNRKQASAWVGIEGKTWMKRITQSKRRRLINQKINAFFQEKNQKMSRKNKIQTENVSIEFHEVEKMLQNIHFCSFSMQKHAVDTDPRIKWRKMNISRMGMSPAFQ